MSGRLPKARRLYEQIAQQVASAIADGKYEVGLRLPSERELAQTFDVSRPTVREAIIALELEQLVEVRLGSGAYVINRTPPAGAASCKDIECFELLEARRAIGGEACAMAAMRIDDAQLGQLSALIEEMREHNRQGEILMSEDAERRFHELIASATQNIAISAAVQMLWDSHVCSPQDRSMSAKVRDRGCRLHNDEHAAIVRALQRRKPVAARAAMREHLSRVIEDFLEAAEVEEMERAHAAAAEKRRRYSSTE